MSPARARTRTAQSGDERTNHEATAPPSSFGPKDPLKKRHLHRYVKMQKYLAEEIDFEFDVRRNSSFHSYLTRRSNELHLPRVRTNWGKQTFIYQASKDWNNDIKNSKSLSLFKVKLKSW